MYSMVLMAALTTGTDLPDFGRRGGCHGCYGCWGGCYGGCWGGCYGGRWGGCYGGWGGCYGGCWGGCYGGGYGWGGWGGGWGGWGGGYGGWGGYGGLGYAAAPVYAGYAAPVIVSNTLPANSALTQSMYYDPGTAANNRATIIVHLPANARLIVDGKPTTSTSATRRFVSPPLQSGQDYHYVFKAEMDRDGEPISVTKRVNVRPGAREEFTLKFADLDQPAERGRQPAEPVEGTGVPRKRKGQID